MGDLEREAMALMKTFGLILPKPVQAFIQKLAKKLDELDERL